MTQLQQDLDLNFATLQVSHAIRARGGSVASLNSNLSLPDYENVLPFYLEQARVGKRVSMVSLVDIDGGSPRPIGSQMAVAEDGNRPKKSDVKCYS